MTFLNNTDKDLALALQLQYNEECQSKIEKEAANDSRHSIVDRSLEFVDPTPDIYALFREFDRVYFWGKLDCCTLKWSPQMTLCAGVCKYEGRGGLCSIHLSAPLLKLRPRKDLVQTLLHEMIHAYLFVTHNNKDHNAHGPEFVKHMNRINQLSGADITIYHSFHDEVDLYRQHWWQCDGPCRHRPPYYGLLKRSKNRAPGPSDPWWKDHQTSCGGTYIKIKTPEPTKGAKRKLKEDAEPVSKVKTNSNFTPFGGKGNTLGSTSDKESAPKLNALTKILTKKSDSTANIKENNTTKNKAITEKSPSKLLRQGNLDNYLSPSSSKKQLPALPKKSHLSSDNCDIIELDTTEYVKCPICEIRCEQTKINEHLDVCLS